MNVAQTNLQLYRELEAAGWSVPDRRRAVAAYELAAELHSGQYRASRKTFVAHLCGTASVAVAAGGTVDETLAALLHAAYNDGDWGDARPEQTERKRAELRTVLGVEAEALVAQYSTWPWRTRLATLLEQGPGAFADWERSVAFVRLANEVDERVDGADDYAPKHAAHVFPLDDVVRCARLLGREGLIPIAERVARSDADADVPAVLQSPTDASSTITPRSLRPRVWLRATGPHSVIRKGAREVPGARRAVHAWRRWRSTAPSE